VNKLIYRKALMALLSCVLSAVLSTSTAIAQGVSVDLPPAGAAVHQIVPSDTDPRINTFSGQGFTHWSWYSSNVPDTGQLVIFLPGTGGKGNGSAPFNSTAVSMGYHVLCLAYPDSISMSMFHGSDDQGAFSKARTNVITGKVQFGNIGVDEANSIENRLVMALRYISRTYPNEHWSQFLDRSGGVAWDRTILSGQSQGGGHACFMAMKLHKVARVLMFGSPKDFNVYYNKPGAWFSEGSATPLNRFFSFVHELDGHNGCTYPQQLSIYQAMRLMPQYSVIDVDRISYPYNHSRLLTSSCDQKNAHVAPIHDERYVNAWKYLLSEPVQ
jgi:hypothetical protein